MLLPDLIAADSNHFVGAVFIALSIIIMSEVLRAGLFLNIAGALWLILAPWMFNNPGAEVLWSQMIAGVILILITFPKGKVKGQHGGFNKYIR